MLELARSPEITPQFRPVLFDRMRPDDFLVLDRQPSQRVCLQGDAPTREEAEILAGQDDAWTVRDAEGRLLACMGILETFEGRSGLVWAVLAKLIGVHHLAISRFAKARIEACQLPRLEALARASDIEPIAARLPDIDPWALLQAAMADPTPECRWPLLLGLWPVHALRRYGPTGETYVLFERIK